MIGMMILGVLVAILAAGSLLTILIASVISVRRQPSWHARCRVVGVCVHCGSLMGMAALVLAMRGSEAELAAANWIVPGLAMVGIVGTALFAAGYLGQVLNSGANRSTKPSAGE